jgi:hypothetical protein
MVTIGLFSRCSRHNECCRKHSHLQKILHGWPPRARHGVHGELVEKVQVAVTVVLLHATPNNTHNTTAIRRRP